MAAKVGDKAPRKPRAAKAGTGGDGRPLDAGDNRRAIEEASRAQLISVVSRLVTQKGKTQAAQTALDTEKAKEKDLLRLGEAAGFAIPRLKRHLAALTGGQTARELAEESAAERREREWLGIPTGETQAELFNEDTPIEVRDEHAVRAEGYLAYQRGLCCEAPSNIGARHVPIWTKGWHDAQEAQAWANRRRRRPRPN